MVNLKLVVEVARAHNLTPKDGHGSSNAFVELQFDGQKFRTTIKEKELNPYWNETFCFNISNPENLHSLMLEAHVYNTTVNNNSKSSLGKVRISGTSFITYSDADVFNYPLERGSMFSRARGELGLKVYLTDDPSIRPSPEMAPSSSSTPQKTEKNTVNGILKGSRRTFYNLSSSSNPLKQPDAPPLHPTDFTLKETNPVLANKRSSIYDLVEPMQFLFVRVVRADNLPSMDVSGSLDPYVEVRLGNYIGVTKHFEKNRNPEWNTVFTFSKDKIQSSVLGVILKDKNTIKDEFVGAVQFDLHEIPTRVPPDSPLAPQWYRLEKGKGELMLAVWFGTQADEAFSEAWHSDEVDISHNSTHIRSKVYHSPRLWYVRLNVIEAQDLVFPEKNRLSTVHVKAQIGNQVLKTRPAHSQTVNVTWNEDLMFVAAEPFDDHLVVTVEARDEALGTILIPLASVERRVDDRAIHSRWFTLQKQNTTRVHLRVCLDGGYHVLDESTHYSSDLRPSAKELWKPPIGLIELGVLSANGLPPMKTRDGRGTSDAYVVAKYGQKWVRTRTVTDTLNPSFNEQYAWEVFDPATVLTVGIFDNGQIGQHNRDTRIGKVRVRVSTLEIDRVYTHSYPLLVLHPSGVKKMGELHLAVRFSCTSMVSVMSLYSKPLLPKMHYKVPLTMAHQDALRHQAVAIVAARLSRAEPPLRKEVVEYMTDAGSHLFSMRKSKANFFRLMAVFNIIFAFGKWLGEVVTWRNPIATVLVHVLFAMVVCFPEMILPTGFVYMFLIGLWNYRLRPKFPPHMDVRLSCADSAQPDELDEEFDSRRGAEVVRMRYDRMRSVAGRVQTVVGDVAAQGERVQGLLSWRDPRATVIFMGFCVGAAGVMYAVNFRMLVFLSGMYVMRHPRFRHRMLAAPINFFRRLPARTDSML